MNGITDEAGKIAVATVESMGKSPFLLALLILNALGIGVATWFLLTLVDHGSRRYEQLFRACLPHLEAPAPKQ